MYPDVHANTRGFDSPAPFTLLREIAAHIGIKPSSVTSKQASSHCIAALLHSPPLFPTLGNKVSIITIAISHELLSGWHVESNSFLRVPIQFPAPVRNAQCRSSLRNPNMLAKCYKSHTNLDKKSNPATGKKARQPNTLRNVKGGHRSSLHRGTNTLTAPPKGPTEAMVHVVQNFRISVKGFRFESIHAEIWSWT